ncbi:MAG: PDZ domain-containing protein [Chloroflexi bacterium]|nr:MAG: PDZ domain-containing protein [Chloroflexota bacterium]
MNRFPALARLVGLHLAPFVLLILGVMLALQSWPLPYIGAIRDQPDNRLVWVDPAGPAARAGLQVGDTLLTVDGVPIGERSPLWGARGTGDRVAIRFQRAGRLHTAQVRLAPPPLQEQAQRLSLFLIAFSFWLIGTVVFFLRLRQPDARRFYLLCLTAATVLTLLPLVWMQVDWATRLNAMAVVWTAVLLVDLHTLFPLPLTHRSWMRVVYGLGGLLTGIYLVWDPQARLNSVPGLWLSDAVFLGFLGAVLASLILLARAYRHAPTATVRRRVRLVLAGTAAGLLPPCLLLFAPLLLRLSPPEPEALLLLSLVLIPLAYAYGIYRYNLMGIDFLINRLVVYLTLGVLLLVVYFAVALLLLEMTGAAGLLAGALSSLIAVALVGPLRQRVDLAWERVFYPDVYGYRGAVDEVSRRLSQALDYEHLTALLVRELCEVMDLEGAALLLVQACPEPGRRACPEPGRRACPEPCNGATSQTGPGAHIIPDQEKHLVLLEAVGTLRSLGCPGAMRLPARGDLARSLVQAGKPVESATLPHDLVGDPALHAAVRLWVPLMVAGELQGVLLLGAKRTDAFFGPRDRQILGMLASQAALAVKNVRLVAELRARMAEIAQDRQALQLAYRHLARLREDERRRLAAELHDDVIQALTALGVAIVNHARSDPLRELEDLTGQVSAIVGRIRRICAGLRPQVLDLGLVPVLRSHLRRFGEETGLEVELEYDEMPELSEEVEVFLFRVVQEALNNVRRHARARSVCVYLAVTSEALELSVTDDGIGFEPAATISASNDHFGLRFMREYVEALGGQLTVRSRPGHGTTVIACVPRQTTEAGTSSLVGSPLDGVGMGLPVG